MQRIDPRSIDNILIRSANWVGDAVMTTPFLRGVRRNFPKSRITLLAKTWVVPVFEHNTDVDDIMVYQAAGRHKGRIGLWRLARDLRSRRFDLAILLQNAFEAALLTALAGIPRRVGYTTDGRSLLLTDRIRSWRPLKKGHLIDYYLGLLTGAGLEVGDRRLSLVITQEERKKAADTLTNLLVADAPLLVGLNPGATFGTAKRWPADRFSGLGKRLAAETGAAILIFGAEAEKKLGEAIAADIGPGCANLCGRTSLRQAMALIQACDLFVTNDSGLMHVAAALDIPQVALIGPTDATATGPSNANSRLLRVSDACDLTPCLKAHCPRDHRCMTAISIEQAFTAGLHLLELNR